MSRRKLESMLRLKSCLPNLTLESYLQEIGAHDLTAAQTAAIINRTLGTSLSAKNLHNVIRCLRVDQFSFRDSRGRRTSAEENAINELNETIRQLTPAQRLNLLASANGLRTATS